MLTESSIEYDKALKRWQRNRDVIAGEDDIKAAGERYLKRLAAMNDTAYCNYVDSVDYFPGTARTLEANVGLVFRKPATLVAPDSLADYFDTVTDALNLEQLARELLTETLVTNWTGLLVDHDPMPEGVTTKAQAQALALAPRLALYKAEAILPLEIARIGNKRMIVRARLYDDAATTEVRALNGAVYSKLHDSLEGELTDRASYEAKWAGTALDKTLGLKTSVEIPPASYLKELVNKSPIDGHLLKSWTDNMSANRMSRVEQQIRLGLVQGENTDKIVARVVGTKAAGYSDGVLDISRRSAQTLVLTASATVANNARIETYRRSGVVKAVKWISTLDSRTTAICQSRDGKVFDINSAFPQPPAHPRCRSILIPVTKSYRELGQDKDEIPPAKRASVDGQVR